MRLTVSQRIHQTYAEPVLYAIDALRLQPRPYEGMLVLNWRVASRGRALPGHIDGLGNMVHCHSIAGLHREATITVTGEVETRRNDGLVEGAPETLPPAFFLRATPLTAVDAAIADLAHASTRVRGTIEKLHDLMQGVRDHLAYRPSAAQDQISAADALRHGTGACQDHAHLFIAGARALGIPARYVSGYLAAGRTGVSGDACHAWAEAFVPELGWVGFDPAHRICPTENYIRVAIGLDCRKAAPVRSVRRGADEESRRVEVRVSRPDADQ
jgi:transglutaminase-like putative cysteine protease